MGSHYDFSATYESGYGSNGSRGQLPYNNYSIAWKRPNVPDVVLTVNPKDCMPDYDALAAEGGYVSPSETDSASDDESDEESVHALSYEADWTSDDGADDDSLEALTSEADWMSDDESDDDDDTEDSDDSDAFSEPVNNDQDEYESDVISCDEEDGAVAVVVSARGSSQAPSLELGTPQQAVLLPPWSDARAGSSREAGSAVWGLVRTPTYTGDKWAKNENISPPSKPDIWKLPSSHAPVIDTTLEASQTSERASENVSIYPTSSSSKKRKQREVEEADEDQVDSSVKSLQTSTNTVPSKRVPIHPPTTPISFDGSLTHVPASSEAQAEITGGHLLATSLPSAQQILPSLDAPSLPRTATNPPVDSPQGQSTTDIPCNTPYEDGIPENEAGSSIQHSSNRSLSIDRRLELLAAEHGLTKADIMPIRIIGYTGTCLWRGDDRQPCGQDLGLLTHENAAAHLRNHAKRSTVEGCQWAKGPTVCAASVKTAGMLRHIDAKHLLRKEARCKFCDEEGARYEHTVNRHLFTCPKLKALGVVEENGESESQDGLS